MTTYQSQWFKKHIHKGSKYKMRRSKYVALLEAVKDVTRVRLKDGITDPLWVVLHVNFSNQKSACVQAWRIEQGFYGDGFEAKTRGNEILVRWVGFKDAEK